MVSEIIPRHQAAFDCIPEHIKQFLQIHAMWSGVSCIRLKKDAYKELMRAGMSGLRTYSHARVLAEAELGVIQAIEAYDSKLWHCARRVNNGYVGIFVYLGTANFEDFLANKPSKFESFRKKSEVPADE